MTVPERAKKPPAKPPQVRRRTAVRRRELIAAAARLFAARGYYAVTVDDIGEAVGLTGPALYRHFSSKEALLVAVFDEVIEELTGRLRQLLGGQPSLPVAEAVLAELCVEKEAWRRQTRPSRTS